jgi:2,3-diketo-5-methylthio-1-phosphopentane phosphatase
MKNYKLKIFCDFDGTISKRDVWINSLGKFINDTEQFETICEEFNAEKINAREANERLLELIENFSYEKFNEYLNSEEIDEYFKDFIEYCIEKDHEVIIVSGGYEYYIDFILKKEHIDMKFFGCELKKSENKKLSSVYLYTDEHCQICETCKRNILLNNTNDLDNEVSVYIGDGISDQCVSGFADIVFAKGKLASYCWKNNITYFEYKNFLDIKNKIIKLIRTNMIKHRQEAKVRRRDVFLGG